MLNATHGVRQIPSAFALECGETIPIEIAYTTYGTLRDDGSNVVLVLHALTGNSDAGTWWNGLIGSGQLIDPARHYIVVPNALGSCYGSTGPDSIDPRAALPYLGSFPEITIRDIARANLALLDELGLRSVALGIGGSMGGMVLLEMAALAPERFAAIIPIAVAADHSPWRIAFSSTIRKTIAAFDETLTDRAKLATGLKLARQFAMTSYRCATEFNTRFSRDPKAQNKDVLSYLEHQGGRIVERFSPYSYLTLTRAMELYDIAKDRGDTASAARSITARALFVGISSDILFEEDEIRRFAKLLPRGEYRTLFADHGHDSFLVDVEELAEVIGPFVENAVPVHEEVIL